MRKSCEGEVLHIDDDWNTTTLSQLILGQEGYRVIVYNDPVEGLEYFKRHYSDINIVLLDQRMPKLSGVEVGRSMRDTDPGVRILMITSANFPPDIRDELRANGYDILPKPFELNDFIVKVKELCPVRRRKRGLIKELVGY